jgi:hypothetical protein
MENLLFGYDCPSIIDIKLGKCPMVDSTMTGSESISGGKTQKLRFRIDGYKVSFVIYFHLRSFVALTLFGSYGDFICALFQTRVGTKSYVN